MKRVLSVCVALLLTAALLVPAARADYLDLMGGSGYAETPLGSSSANKIHNIDLAAGALNGYVVEQGGSFSFNTAVGPRTAEMGYLTAENGRGVKVRGGGVAQVATTVYLAVRDLDGVVITEKHTYGKKFTDGYVANSDDAILTDYKAGTDFCFTNWGEALEILVWEDGANVCCSVGPLFNFEEGDTALIGYGTTWVEKGTDRRANIERAAEAVSGVSVSSGGTFSFNTTVGPRTKAAGYRSAVNGRGVRVTGGGVAQLASTIYLAVKDLDCVTITEKRTYGSSYNQTYVADPEDAIVTDWGAGTDFAFRYAGAGERTLYTYSDETGWLCCEVWESGDGWSWSE